ncbi:MAG TPA: hypothetical protein VMF11_02530 [Candidatus Baltobacteraceae bacterium]|nr:hypothetical protein [Candidatus Baltobacteraceae bacterium]
MKRTVISLAALLAAYAIPVFAQTPDNETLLLHRLAAIGGGTAAVYVGTLPADMPKVPLPSATIVGSVHQSLESPVTVDTYNLYYNAGAGTLKAYGAALIAAGWKEQPFPTNAGGFVSSTGPQTAIYCKANAPLITAQTGAADPQDLRVSISEQGTTGDLICGRNPLMALVSSALRSPLPKLQAPVGVRMSVSQIGFPSGQSAAYIHNGSSAGALLDGFANQMTAAGWQAGTKSSGTSLASQTFQKVDAKNTPWRCVISVVAIDGKPGEFVAFISTADVKALSKGESALFQQ